MLKVLVVLAVALSAQSVFADCVSVGLTRKICVGDLVFRGGLFNSGAIVTEIESSGKNAKVITTGEVRKFTVPVGELYVTNACLFGVCTGDTVNRGNHYFKDAIVMGINFGSRRVTVQSINNGDLFGENVEELDVKAFNPSFLIWDRLIDENGFQIEGTSPADGDSLISSLFCREIKNSNGRVLARYKTLVEFVETMVEKAVENNRCVVGNVFGRKRTHIILDGNGVAVGSGLSAEEAAKLRSDKFEGNCMRFTCKLN